MLLVEGFLDMSFEEDSATPTGMQFVLYCFTPSGLRLPPEIIDARDDRMAIDMVRLQLHKRCELWQGNRLVFALPEIRVSA